MTKTVSDLFEERKEEISSHIELNRSELITNRKETSKPADERGRPVSFKIKIASLTGPKRRRDNGAAAARETLLVSARAGVVFTAIKLSTRRERSIQRKRFQLKAYHEYHKKENDISLFILMMFPEKNSGVVSYKPAQCRPAGARGAAAGAAAAAAPEPSESSKLIC
ncbi:hypothetical protein EVAR_22948_1 [Eumeta japonica]|uniref:Uncharacterized protein n=1 Tax=Eumeta variegata TaxID=151549 RepID=A0A4C1UR32_EUMVA|nr:hypothetical protein EVAR_22948_1 [Eumeta japonica]